MADPGKPPARDHNEDSEPSAGGPSRGETPPPRAADATRIYNADTADAQVDPAGFRADVDDWQPPPQLGKYTLEEQIGRGGMGVVWKGHDPGLNRTVAIKLLAPQLAQSRTARQRFQREARAAAAISHPHVLTIHAVDEQDQVPFLVMEYVSGGSLKEYVSQRGKLPFVQAIQLSCQIAQGLAAAHAQGVIHRDVKPGNVMLHEGGVRVRLADFGLARAAFDNSELTSHDQAVGTPAYMAPEQLRGDRIDARADLFSLGCVMHYMLVGHPPFQGRTQAETIHKLLGEVPRPLLEIDSTIPPALAEIVDRLLRKDPEERYQSAFEVAAVLERFLILLNQAPTDEIANILARPELARPGHEIRSDNTSGRKRTVLAIGAVVCLMVVAVVLGIVFRPPNTSPVDSSSGAEPATTATGAIGRAPTRMPQILTVAREGDAAYRNFDDALAAAQSGDTVRVIDDATYEVNLNLQHREQMVLEATAEAKLVAQDPNRDVIRVHGGKEVQIRGFRITTTGVEQHAVRLTECDGVRLEKLKIRQEGAEQVAAIHVADCNVRSDGAPLEIVNCRIETLSTGQCVWVEANHKPVWNLRLADNWFHGPRSGTLAVLVAREGSVTIENNIFSGGWVGLNLNLMLPEDSQGVPAAVKVVNNAFFNCRSWIGLWYTEPDQTPFTLANNLILECDGVEASPAQQHALAEHCVLGGNVWERPSPPPVGDEELQRWARFEPVVAVESREPMSEQFLRLPADSPLLKAGAGGDQGDRVGAEP